MIFSWLRSEQLTMRNSPTADQNTLYRIRYIHGQMSSPTSQIIVHHIMRATRVCRPPHPNGILSSTIQTGWALFSINTTLPAIHTHLISQFACKQSTFHTVKVTIEPQSPEAETACAILGCGGRSSSTSVGPRWIWVNSIDTSPKQDAWNRDPWAYFQGYTESEQQSKSHCVMICNKRVLLCITGNALNKCKTIISV